MRRFSARGALSLTSSGKFDVDRLHPKVRSSESGVGFAVCFVSRCFLCEKLMWYYSNVFILLYCIRINIWIGERAVARSSWGDPARHWRERIEADLKTGYVTPEGRGGTTGTNRPWTACHAESVRSSGIRGPCRQVTNDEIAQRPQKPGTHLPGDLHLPHLPHRPHFRRRRARRCTRDPRLSYRNARSRPA